MMEMMFGRASAADLAGALSLRVVLAEQLSDAAPSGGNEGLLGDVWHAGSTVSRAGGLHVDMPPLLDNAQGVLERWSVGTPVRGGRLGPADFRCTDRLLFVAISIDEQDADIGTAAEQAYAALFAVMDQEKFSHLVRCWNYFADINEEQATRDGSLERYRLFNIGRQAAFSAAEHSAEVGAPAACALGTRSGPLVIYALAARVAPLCIENPRQVSAYRYPSVYGPKSPSFSRASVLRDGDDGDILFVSGTASIVGHESVHLGDPVAQTEEALRNIVTVVAQANLRLGREAFSAAKLCYKVFVRREADAQQVADTVRSVLGAATRMIVLRADVCRAELLVEIEAVGFA
jgi:enamine deaminase RidA (YjgF/YER057c/UK114 family)